MVDDNARHRVVIRLCELVEDLGSKVITVNNSYPPKHFSKFQIPPRHDQQAHLPGCEGAAAANTSVNTSTRTVDPDLHDVPQPRDGVLRVSEPHPSRASPLPVVTIDARLGAATDLPIPPTPSSRPTHAPAARVANQAAVLSGAVLRAAAGDIWRRVRHGRVGRPRDTHMQDVDVVELHTGNFILGPRSSGLSPVSA